MQVHFKKPQQHVDVRGNRGRHFDSAVASVAPGLNQLRSAGVCNIRHLANCLNDNRVLAPSGGPFSYATTRRVLRRLEALHLGSGPGTLGQAASQRPPRPYKSRAGKPKTSSILSALKKALAEHGCE